MFQNAQNTSLSGFSKDELLSKLNVESTLDYSMQNLENSGEPIHMSQMQWNNTVHFDLTYTPWKHLGYKMVVASLANQMVKGTRSEAITLSICTSSVYSLDALEEFIKGFGAAASKFACKYAVVDLSTCASGIFFTATTLSSSPCLKQPWLSSEFGAGDLVCVSGDLGAAYLGLMLLEREKRIFKENPDMQPDLEGKDYIVGRQLKPELRTDVLDAILKENIEFSRLNNIDEGLAASLKQVIKDTEYGVVLYEDKLPIDTETLMQCIDFGIDVTVAALNGGEDYEFCFVIPQSEFGKIDKLNTLVSVVGYISDQTKDVLIQLKSGKSEKVDTLKLS